MRCSVVRTVQFRSVDRKTEGSLDARTESLSVSERQHTGVVNLRLDERSLVKVPKKRRKKKIKQTTSLRYSVNLAGGRRGDLRLGANLKRDTISRLSSVVRRTTASLDVTAHTMIITRRERRQLVRRQKRNSVLRCAKPSTSGVAGNLAGADVVLRFRAKQEAVPADNGVSSEGRTLYYVR